jgi:DNA-binding LacI/PurR family transcriptional regulator
MLARGSNQIIGFLSFDNTFRLAESDFYYPYLVGIQREAGEQNYHIMLFNTNNEIYQNGMNSLRLADGVILTGTYPDPRVMRQLAEENYPFVLLGECDALNNEIDSVQSDHEPAACEATRHLLDLGHRSLGIVVEEMSQPHHRQRLAGSERAVKEYPDSSLTVLTSKDLESPDAFRETLLEHQITGLLCAHRNLTLPVVDLIQQLAFRIPEDVSLVFLSTTWGVPFVNPTRVKLNRDTAGQEAVKRLIQRLQGSLEGYQRTLIPCDLVIGETTAPASR